MFLLCIEKKEDLFDLHYINSRKLQKKEDAPIAAIIPVQANQEAAALDHSYTSGAGNNTDYEDDTCIENHRYQSQSESGIKPIILTSIMNLIFVV